MNTSLAFVARDRGGGRFKRFRGKAKKSRHDRLERFFSSQKLDNMLREGLKQEIWDKSLSKEKRKKGGKAMGSKGEG